MRRTMVTIKHPRLWRCAPPLLLLLWGGAGACSSSEATAPLSLDGGADGTFGDDAASCPNANGPLDAAPAQLELPHPTGPYAIGTQLRQLVDLSRTDPQAPDKSTNRKLMVQLYYPTDPCETGQAPPYLSAQEAQVYGQFGGGSLPEGWQTKVLQHGRNSIPLASGDAKFPTVLFSHGMGALRGMYVALIEDLVSHGFVVVAISHTYDSAVVVFPDASAALPNGAWKFTGDSAADEHIAGWVADARFVLDEVTQLDQSDPLNLLTGRLDLDHAGMFGHSYGGATSAEACALDPRFKAGIDLDGTFYSPAREDGGRAIPTPFMMQLSELNGLAQDSDPSFQNTYSRLQDAGYAVQIAGSRHRTFTDVGLVFHKFVGPDAGDEFVGTIDPVRALSIIDAYTLAFFQKFLKGTSEPLLDGPPAYPEVTFNKR